MGVQSMPQSMPWLTASGLREAWEGTLPAPALLPRKPWVSNPCRPIHVFRGGAPFRDSPNASGLTETREGYCLRRPCFAQAMGVQSMCRRPCSRASHGCPIHVLVLAMYTRSEERCMASLKAPLSPGAILVLRREKSFPSRRLRRRVRPCTRNGARQTLARQPTTIHRKDRAVDIVRGSRRKEHGRAAEVRRLAPPAGWNAT
jgi:hypothetical protein